MDVAITGSSGLIGSALRDHLSGAGHRVRRVVRGPEGENGDGDIHWDPESGTIDRAALEGVDAIVHLAGAGIAENRWTDKQKARIRSSRNTSTSLIAETVAAMDPMPRLLSGSAVGFYGDTGDRLTDEHGPNGTDFLSEVVRDWEAAATPAIEAGAPVAFLRSGVVLSTKGGFLHQVLPFFKAFLGGHSKSGRQYISWISIVDEVRAIEHLLTSSVTGPVNLVAPNPATNRELTGKLGTALHRPTTIIPMIGPRLLMGRELADSLLLVSQRIDDGVLRDQGFGFEHPTLDAAFADLLA
jgi:uncharacterized protein (TIGR01777 family)